MHPSKLKSGRARVARLSLLLAGAALSGMVCAPLQAEAKAYKVLHAFCTEKDCADGDFPFSPLISDAAGNLYGTTFRGGAFGSGTVYRLAPNADKTQWSYSVLYSFCARSACSDGGFPGPGKLAIDAQGKLYGTTSSSDQGGTAFRLSPDADPGKLWNITILHAFCKANGGNCADGDMPYSALAYAGSESGVAYDGTSPLYGMTVHGGLHGGGIAFSLKPTDTDGQEKVVYHFCSAARCTDGSQPAGALVMARQDKLYGTTTLGGQHNGGTVFELDRGKTGWSQTVLHHFCAKSNCTDGSEPAIGGLVLDADGALYGSALLGGANLGGGAYRLAPDGERSQFSLLYSFCRKADCSDGKLPDGNLIMNASGTIYGTLFGGGNHGNGGGYSHGAGMVYSLTGGVTKILHKFCTKSDCSDGSQPFAGLVTDASGRAYGTTSSGGAHSGGVVFAITP